MRSILKQGKGGSRKGDGAGRRRVRWRDEGEAGEGLVSQVVHIPKGRGSKKAAAEGTVRVIGGSRVRLVGTVRI